MSNSSRNCLRQETLEVGVENDIVWVGIVCTKWPPRSEPRAYKLLEEIMREKEILVASAVKPELAGSLERILSAAYTVYKSFSRGKSIARKPGIELLLYLLGERNISRVVGRYDPAGKALVVLVARHRDKLKEALRRAREELGEETCCISPEDTLELLRREGRLNPPGSCGGECARRLLETYTSVFSGVKPKE